VEAIFDGAVVVSFLFHYRVIVNDVAKSVEGNVVVGNR
jgi:hypothetical protein